MSKEKNKIPSISIILIIISFFIMTVSKAVGIVLITAIILFNILKRKYLINVIKGNRAYTAKDYATAIEEYKKAVSSKYANAGIIRGYILIELKHGDPERAKEVLDKLLAERKFKDHEMLNLNVSKALILWKTGNIEVAINKLKDLLSKEKSSYIYETLTSLLLISGRVEESLELLKEGLEYDDSNNILKSNFGEANFKLGNTEVAEETFASLLEENILFIEPYYFYALILKQKGETEKAIELLEKALDTNDSLLTTVSKDSAEKVLYELTPNI